MPRRFLANVFLVLGQGVIGLTHDRLLAKRISARDRWSLRIIIRFAARHPLALGVTATLDPATVTFAKRL